MFSLAARMSNQSEILQNVGEEFPKLVLRRISKLGKNLGADAWNWLHGAEFLSWS